MTAVIPLFASDLGWGPGRFAKEMTHGGEQYRQVAISFDRERDITWAEYHPVAGPHSQYPSTIIRVFND